MIRKPIITIMGHVDHGKTKLLDRIRHTTVTEREAGAITQAIGASIVPIETIKKICGKLLEQIKTDITVPGLLFIDTPGHAAFTNLRRRGGNLADLAILIIDINEGIKPQTEESIEILKKYKTPFIVVANKIDLLPGWKKDNAETVISLIEKQNDSTKKELDKKIYEIVGRLYELGLNSERFDRISSHTEQIAIIPASALLGYGLPEILMLLTGLAQKFLSEKLSYSTESPAKGTILEVKEEKGLGTTLDLIIYDGTLKVNDTVVIGAIDEPIITKVKALFEPMPLSEMRDKKSRFRSVKQVFAATGVKMSAQNIKDAVAGMPIAVAVNEEEIEKIKKEIMAELKEVIIETENSGIVVKADSIGSLEAVITLLREKKIPIKKANIGNISKKDIAEAVAEKEKPNAVVIGFNVSVNDDALAYAENEGITIFTEDIIYSLIDRLEEWREGIKKKEEDKKMKSITRPCKIEIMKGYVFRQSNPAVFGVVVLEGTLKTGMQMIKKDNTRLSSIKGIQLEQKSISEAEKNMQVAVSMDNVAIGRQLNENDILYSDITEEEFRKLKELKDMLSSEEKDLLKEIAEIKRKQNPLWGV